MEHFYVVLPSDSSSYYFPRNTIANFRTKLATPIEIEHDKWEVGLIEISYPRGYKKKLQQNILLSGSQEIKFPVQHYRSMVDLIGTLSPFLKTSEKNEFVTIYNTHLDNFIPLDGPATLPLRECAGQNSFQVEENVVSHFPVRAYNGLEDLVSTILDPTNCRSSKVTLTVRDNYDFVAPEPVYIYTDIIKPNLVGDSYVRLLRTLHFPTKTGNHRFDYPLYRPVEQSFIESIAIRLVTKTGEDVEFADSDIPCLVILHFKKKSSA